MLNRDNNIRYVALHSLTKVVADDKPAVQRHRTTIVECLKDPDVSIRQRAMDLTYVLVDETNVKQLAREMLNYLVVAPTEQKADLVSKIAEIMDKFAPTKLWHIDTMVTLLAISGNHVGDRIQSSVIGLIQGLFFFFPTGRVVLLFRTGRVVLLFWTGRFVLISDGSSRSYF